MSNQVYALTHKSLVTLGMWRTFIKDSRNSKVLSSFLFELIIALVANSRARALAEVKEPFEEKVTELRNCLENAINGGHGTR
jgi:hypothetical protein